MCAVNLFGSIADMCTSKWPTVVKQDIDCKKDDIAIETLCVKYHAATARLHCSEQLGM